MGIRDVGCSNAAGGRVPVVGALEKWWPNTIKAGGCYFGYRIGSGIS